jgi:hypothetical protein
MNVLKRTPKVRLTQRLIGTKALGITKRLADEMGFPEPSIAEELYGLVIISAGVSFDKGEIDFEPITPTDDEEQIAAKFVAYMNSDCLDVMDKAWVLYSETERPAEGALSPTAPKESDDPKSRS